MNKTEEMKSHKPTEEVKRNPNINYMLSVGALKVKELKIRREQVLTFAEMEKLV